MAEKKETTLVLQTYKNKELVEGLSWLLDQALNGEISGACFMIEYSQFKHSIGILGNYRKNPYNAIRPINRLKNLIDEIADELEEYTEHEIEY